MKWLKFFLLPLLATVILYFAYFKRNESIIDGHWFAKKIIFDGKQIFPTSINEYFTINSEVIIDSWNDSIYINVPIENKKLNASYILVNDNKDYQIKLKSKAKSLNGNFKIELDTVKLQTNFYKIELKMSSKNSLIQLERNIDTSPRKPEIYRKGRP